MDAPSARAAEAGTEVGATPGAAVGVSPRRAAWMMLLLCLIAISNFGDRSLLSVLMQPLKAEMHISDTILGALGFLFSLAYSTCAFPIARVSDRGDRVRVLTVCLTLWSLFTAATGAVQNGVQLALVRMGVACSESGGHPATQALIVDLFPARRRASMLSIYAACGPLGASVGLALGGVLAAQAGWRGAFVAMGLPGLLLALVILMTARDPRTALRSGAGEPVAQVPLREFFAMLAADPVLRLVLLIVGCVTFGAGGVAVWLPSFFIRLHHLPLREVGPLMGVATLFGGVCGGLLAGIVSDRLATRDLRWYPRVGALGIFLALPAMLLVLLLPDPKLALGALFVERFLSSFWLGPVYALMLTLTAPGIRALVSATLATLANLSGGLGSFTVGFLSDRLQPLAGAGSLRDAMLCAVAPVAIAGLACLLLQRHAKARPD